MIKMSIADARMVRIAQQVVHSIRAKCVPDDDFGKNCLPFVEFVRIRVLFGAKCKPAHFLRRNL